LTNYTFNNSLLGCAIIVYSKEQYMLTRFLLIAVYKQEIWTFFSLLEFHSM